MWSRERKKMDAEDKAADELAIMRLRVATLRETANHYRELSEESVENKEKYFRMSFDLTVITAEYAGLTARRAAELGQSA
jgi:hypothetical protein